MSSACLFLFVATTHVHRIIGQAFIEFSRDGASSPLVEITVSPMATESSLRVLDISWNVHHRWQLGDWVALYSEPPNTKSQNSLFSGPADSGKGWLRTGIPENRTSPGVPDFEKKCLGLWAAYWSESQDKPVATNCISTNPTWMADNWESIKRLKLAQVFLPGSHNAGSYQLAYTPFEPNIFDKYVYTQDESILEQLIHGVRYLDFRIGRYAPVKSFVDLLIRPAGSEFWLNHDFVQVNRLATALNEVKLFLNNTQEIVVIDIHAFPVGFKKRSKSHVELIEFLNLHLGDHLTSYTGYETTLEQLRGTGKRLILAYNRASIVHMHYSILWPPISQKWGDVRSVQDLHKYLTIAMAKRHPSGMSAVMAELTPTAWDLVTDEHRGLRNMMDNCNHNVTEWFRDDWGLTANAVAVDFIRSTGIVSAAIKWNKEKTSLSRESGNETGNVH